MWNYRHSWLLLLAVAVAPVDAAPPKEKPDLGTPSGKWEGEYRYPKDQDREAVKFEMEFTPKELEFTATTKEPNTFAGGDEPSLFAKCKGTFDDDKREVTWTKTYDGTAGVNHDVEYTGTLSRDGTTIEGTWAIGELKGTFTLKKLRRAKGAAPTEKPGLGALSGRWGGEYRYPGDDGRAAVKFEMDFTAKADKFTATTKEPNTFAGGDEPFLNANCDGRFDGKRELTWTKTYDGTAGVTHSVDYTGSLSLDGTTIEGTWAIGELMGTFTLKLLGPAAAAPTEKPRVRTPSGKWGGEYRYPGDDGRAAVNFEMEFTAKADKFTATTKEPNTFAGGDEPSLFAKCEGTFDGEKHEATWTKTYDGTAGVTHSVEYSGTLSKDGTTIEGTWAIGELKGTFTLKKLRR